jgi:CRP/FNR family transcriptional regulator, dissimilatory nitrate respiration regulator
MLQSLFFIFGLNFMDMKFPQLLRSPLFKGLTDDEIEALLSKINFRVRSFAAGSMVAQSADSISSLLIILSGHVRGEMMDLSGHTIKIEDIYPPQALAAAFLFGSGSHYPVNVYANIDSEVLIIDKKDFLALLHESKTMLLNYLDAVCSKAHFLSERLRFLSFRTIKGKLAHYLLGLPGGPEGSVVLDKSQQQLADYFGVARPSLARALKDMEVDGLIDASRRQIKLLKRDELIRLTAV